MDNANSENGSLSVREIYQRIHNNISQVMKGQSAAIALRRVGIAWKNPRTDGKFFGQCPPSTLISKDEHCDYYRSNREFDVSV